MNLGFKPIIMSDFKSTVDNYLVYDHYYDSMVRPHISRKNLYMVSKEYIKYGYYKRMPIRFYIEYTRPISDLIRPGVRPLQLIKQYPTYVNRGGKRYDPV